MKNHGLYFYICECYDDRVGGHQYTKLIPPPLSEEDWVKTPAEALKLAARDLLTRVLKEGWQVCGWEGDGDIEYTTLPPYVFDGVQDGYWKIVYHVKQENNGTSFIASTVPLLSNNLKFVDF